MKEESRHLIEEWIKIQAEKKRFTELFSTLRDLIGNDRQYIQILKNEVIHREETISDNGKGDCSDCVYEIYMEFYEDEDRYFYRDCMSYSKSAQEHFNNKVVKKSKHSILPIKCQWCKK